MILAYIYYAFGFIFKIGCDNRGCDGELGNKVQRESGERHSHPHFSSLVGSMADERVVGRSGQLVGAVASVGATAGG